MVHTRSRGQVYLHALGRGISVHHMYVARTLRPHSTNVHAGSRLLVSEVVAVPLDTQAMDGERPFDLATCTYCCPQDVKVITYKYPMPHVMSD